MPLTHVPEVQSLVVVQAGAHNLGSAETSGANMKESSVHKAGTLGRWDMIPLKVLFYS